MKLEVSIGEMHHFELCDALHIYRESRRSFITLHAVTAQKQGPPLLGPAQPLLSGTQPLYATSETDEDEEILREAYAEGEAEEVDEAA